MDNNHLHTNMSEIQYDSQCESHTGSGSAREFIIEYDSYYMKEPLFLELHHAEIFSAMHNLREDFRVFTHQK